MAPMNFKLLVLCFLLISTAHYFLFAQIIQKEPTPIHKPKYQKVTLQMATYKEPIIEKPKEIKPEPKKIEEVKKPIIKKPIIKKKAIKKIVKKKPKKIKKTKPKKVVKKVIKKPIVKKTVVKKEPIKKIKKIDKKEVKKVSNINKAQSLERYKQYKQTYLTKLRAKIDSNKKYPSISRRLKEQGIVTVSFRVMKNGIFKNIKVSKSSNKRRLDKAAIKALETTNHFDAFTKEIKDDFLDITLQIAFKLK